MPRGDRTGPSGFGPGTGRAAGFCSGYDRPGFMNGGFGRGAFAGRGYGRGFGGGAGFGRGSGRGFRFPFFGAGHEQTYSPGQEIDIMRKDIVQMEAELKAAREDLERMEKGNAAEE